MKISIPLIACGLLLSVGSLYAQPNLNYVSSPVSLKAGTAVGTAPNPAISISNSGGAVVTTFGFSNTATQPLTAGSLNAPARGAVDATGNIYIASFTGNNISKFTASGALVTNTYTSGGIFNSPAEVCFDSSGNMWVLNGNATLLKFSTTGAFISSTTLTVGGTTYGLAIDASNNMYVSSVDGTGGLDRIVKVTSALVQSTIVTTTGLNDPVEIGVDASANLYVLNLTSGNVSVYSSTGTQLAATFATGYTGGNSYGLAVDALNNYVYVADNLNKLIKVYATGTSNSAALLTTITVPSTDYRGLILDLQGNVYAPDFTANVVNKYRPTGGPYFINRKLPTGLSFNKTTGAVTGTASAASPATDYIVSAYNASGGDSFPLNILAYTTQYQWKGTGTTWNTASNWNPGVVPGVGDQALIGAGTQAITNNPVIATGTSFTVGSIVLGTLGGKAATITVNGTGVLNVTGNITMQSDASSALATSTYVTALSGTGTINAANLNIKANTTISGTVYTEKLTTSVTNLNLSGGIGLNTAYVSGTQIGNANLIISGGTVNATDYETINPANAAATSTLTMTGGTLNFTGSTPLFGLSSTGTNTFTLSAGSTIGYTGSNSQTVYTNSAIIGLPGGISYKGLTLSGTGTKTAPAGTLNIGGNFTNSLANDVNNYFDASGADVVFNGTTQALAGGSGIGTDFTDVTFSGGGVKTMSGKFNIIPTGSLTMGSGTTQLATGGVLTLESDANNTAYIATIPSGSSVTGNVNVERYISGGLGASRGYRLLSSPVSVSSGSLIYPSLDFIKNGMYTTGTSGGTNGFNASGNPTIYIYREDIQPNFSSFISGNFRGVAKINNTTASNFNIDTDGGPFNIFAGDGVLAFFRGPTNIANPTLSSTIATPSTLTSTGYLNQGNILVKNWFTPASNNLSYTAGTAATVRGFNLVGNPYASSIDWDVVYTTGTANVDNKIYVYNPYCRCYSTYKAGDLGVGTSTNGAGNNSDIIPTGQGFFIRTLSTGTPTLTFAESHKVTTQKAASNTMLATAVTPQTIKYLRLQLKLDNENVDDALVFFSPDATANYIAEEDGEYLRGNNTLTISTVAANNVNLAINHLSFPAAKALVIPVNATISANGAYQLNLTEAVNIPSQYKIWLKDSFLADSVDIQANPIYNFNALATDSATFGKRRFSLVIRQDAAFVYKLLEFTATKAFAKVDLQWKTQNAVGNYSGYTIERSIDGGNSFQVLGNVQVTASQNTYTFTDPSPKLNAQNIYRLKQEGVNSPTNYSELVVAAYSSLIGEMVKNQVHAYPNPTRSTIGLLVVDLSNKLNTTGADYTIAITNSMGSVMKTYSTQEPYIWQGDVSTFSPGTYFVQLVNNKTKTVIGNSKFVKL